VLNPVPLTVELAERVVNAPVLAVVAPTVPFMLIEAVPVKLVTVPADGVPISPPLIRSVPVASGNVIVGVPEVAADCIVCVPAPLALPWTLIFAI
jgi:hypothetical protein